jgi:hypothetical protein
MTSQIGKLGKLVVFVPVSDLSKGAAITLATFMPSVKCSIGR